MYLSEVFSDLYKNGSLFIRPFREYFKPIHAGSFICQAKNPAGSIQSLSIQLKPRNLIEYIILLLMSIIFIIFFRNL